MSDLSGVFKATNLFVGISTALWGLVDLTNFNSFFLGLYLLAFGASITLLEFRVPPLTHQYASFLFSFLGRGVFYILLGILICSGGILSAINGIFVVIVGGIFLSLEFVPSIEVPDNFRTDGSVLIEDEENEVI